MALDQEADSALPVRTSRYRRTGRHSSPHQLSLPSDAPALVIAVPGAANPESDDIAYGVASLASSSCPGADVRIGYVGGRKHHLAEVLRDVLGEGKPPAVVVPLLAFPHPETDAAIARIASTAGGPLVVAGHLGPHPLLAEAVHVRLAEAGLARAARAGRISIVTAADGLIVGAAGNQVTVQAAGVVAVLLASRLTLPVAPASLTDQGSLMEATSQLRAARVARVAVAPCVIGPELPPGTLEAITAQTGAACARPLGGHPTVGQLVAIRYGAALADPRMASITGLQLGSPAGPDVLARR